MEHEGSVGQEGCVDLAMPRRPRRMALRLAELRPIDPTELIMLLELSGPVALSARDSSADLSPASSLLHEEECGRMGEDAPTKTDAEAQPVREARPEARGQVQDRAEASAVATDPLAAYADGSCSSGSPSSYGSATACRQSADVHSLPSRASPASRTSRASRTSSASPTGPSSRAGPPSSSIGLTSGEDQGQPGRRAISNQTTRPAGLPCAPQRVANRSTSHSPRPRSVSRSAASATMGKAPLDPSSVTSTRMVAPASTTATDTWPCR